MRFTHVGYALGVAAAVAVFAGCSSTSSSSSLGPVVQHPSANTQSIVHKQTPVIAVPKAVFERITPTTGHGRNWQGVRPDRTVPYITGCQFYGVNCNLYRGSHDVVVGTIAASYVNGICVDPSGNVWIPDGGAQTISEYPHGSTTPVMTLNNSGIQPSSCAVDAYGNVYVGNISAGVISVFRHGQTTASRYIKVNSLLSGSTVQGYLIGVALDEGHRLAVSWINFSTGTSGVDTYTEAKQSTETTVIHSTDFLGGVTFDKNENIVLNDQSTGTIDVYPPSGGTATCTFGYYSGDAVMAALDHSNGDAYVGDAVNNVVDDINYSPTCSNNAGGLEHQYTGFPSGSSVIGVAISPGQTL